MSLSGNFNTNKYSTSSSGTIGLNLSWTGTQSIETNSTTIKWTLKSNGTMSSGYSVQGGPITVSIGGTTVLNLTGRFKVNGSGGFKKTGSITITHNEDGTKSVYMSVRAALYSASVNCTGSYTYTLDTIQRFAYVTSVDNFTDESNPVMNYANPLGDVLTSTQACISLDDTGVNPLIAYRDIDINGSSYTFELTTANREALRAACPNSNTLTTYFIIKSIMNGQTFYSKKSAIMSIVNGNPTITNAQYYDTNADIIAVTDDPTKIVQALSTVEFKFGTLSAIKYATLVSATITINGVSEAITLSGTTQTNVTKLYGSINVSSSLPAIVDVVDSRGNHTSLEITLDIYAWSVPTGSISLGRINNFETDCILKVQASYSSIAGTNSVTITYQTKKTSDADYGSEVTIQDNTSYVVQLDNTYEWNVRVKITDLIGGTSTYNLTVGKGIPIIFFDRILRSMSVNCFPLHSDSIDVDGDIYCNKMPPKALTYTSSKSSGNWYINSITAIRSGSTVSMVVSLKGNGSAVSAGSNAFVGSLSGGPLPALSTRFVTYNASSIITCALEPNGAFTVRVSAASITISRNAEAANLCGSFVVDD